MFERFPKLRFALIECGIGWVPWALDAMDEAYRKHHLWAFPKLKQLPSEYFRQQRRGFLPGGRGRLASCRSFNLVDNFMWANDYPHAEGTWPHSAEAIERQMQHLTDAQRAKILGLNMAKMFKFDVAKLTARRAATRPAAIN